MASKVLQNPLTSNWAVDIMEHNELEQYTPLNFISVRNDSSIVANVYLTGALVGQVQRYSSDTYAGIPFSDFRIQNPDGDSFGENELFVQVAKDVSLSSLPYNPQWDILEDDFDRFATGCDHRISLSDTITALKLKYWLNVQRDLIVQRRIDIQGSAELGTCTVAFSPDDILRLPTGVNFPTSDTKRYKKTNSDGAFTYTQTNCTITGWIFDYKKDPNDISSDYTVIAGNSNAYDDDLSTYIAANFKDVWYTIFHASFSTRHISHISTFFVMGNTLAGYSTTVKLQIYIQSGWTDVFSDNTGDDGIYVANHSSTGWDDVTEIRVIASNTYAGTATKGNAKIYDISAFP